MDLSTLITDIIDCMTDSKLFRVFTQKLTPFRIISSADFVVWSAFFMISSCWFFWMLKTNLFQFLWIGLSNWSYCIQWQNLSDKTMRLTQEEMRDSAKNLFMLRSSPFCGATSLHLNRKMEPLFESGWPPPKSSFWKVYSFIRRELKIFPKNFLREE